ncbi:MAG: winged helix-turn-helix domain-containing protein [Acidobacteria bacterium]|nr:winged helix-turn-helix domain-containing protein [Acidobacteriota bacterium]
MTADLAIQGNPLILCLPEFCSVASQVKLNVVRFGVYEFAPDTRELWRQGIRVRLEGQPVAILKMLLDRRGELVTREELQKELWPQDTFVDFEHSLNAAVKRLRAALHDSADQPRYIETLARRGYRFIAPVAGRGDGTSAPASVAVRTPLVPTKPLSVGYRKLWLLAPLLCAIAIVAWAWREWRHRQVTAARVIRSVAVLPLENLSGDPSQEYLADGLTEELIGRLSNIHGLRVISRTSSMQFKHTNLSVPAIAGTLGVDAVVEGSVIREASRVRVHAQLIRGASDEHIWAEQYQGEYPSILGLQEDVTRKIAERLQASLAPQERRRLAPSRTVDPEAHEDYLKGLYYFNQRTSEALNKSIAYFRQAIARDPNYALCYSGLADAYALLGFRDGVLSNEDLARAKAAATKAIELDPSLAEPHSSLAFIAETQEWNWAAAEREYKRALELNPGDAGVHHWYAGYLVYVGRPEQGVTEESQARDLDPVSLPVNNALAGRLLAAGRDDEALAQVEKTLELDSHFAAAHQTLGWIYLNKRKPKEAVNEFKEAVQASGPDDTEFILDLAFAYAIAGNRGEAHRILAKLIQEHERGTTSSAPIAILYGALGELDEAFAWLDKAYEERDPELTYLNVRRRRFEPLRRDPRFKKLLLRMGLGN